MFYSPGGSGGSERLAPDAVEHTQGINCCQTSTLRLILDWAK